MNLTVGDRITWDAPQFVGGSAWGGRFRGARYNGTVRLSGIIEHESYGRETGQHTFSIRLTDGTLKRVKGRNLYPHIVEYEAGPDHAEQEARKADRIALATETNGVCGTLPARLRAERTGA